MHDSSYSFDNLPSLSTGTSTPSVAYAAIVRLARFFIFFEYKCTFTEQIYSNVMIFTVRTGMLRK